MSNTSKTEYQASATYHSEKSESDSKDKDQDKVVHRLQFKYLKTETKLLSGFVQTIFGHLKRAMTIVSNSFIKRYCHSIISSNYRSFDDYHVIIFSTWHAIFGKDSNEKNWKNAKYSYSVFFNNYICKYIIGLAVRIKFIVILNKPNTVPIGEKHKRGRPARAKKTLQIQ